MAASGSSATLNGFGPRPKSSNMSGPLSPTAGSTGDNTNRASDSLVDDTGTGISGSVWTSHTSHQPGHEDEASSSALGRIGPKRRSGNTFRGPVLPK